MSKIIPFCRVSIFSLFLLTIASGKVSAGRCDDLLRIAGQTTGPIRMIDMDLTDITLSLKNDGLSQSGSRFKSIMAAVKRVDVEHMALAKDLVDYLAFNNLKQALSEIIQRADLSGDESAQKEAREIAQSVASRFKAAKKSDYLASYSFADTLKRDIEQIENLADSKVSSTSIQFAQSSLQALLEVVSKDPELRPMAESKGWTQSSINQALKDLSEESNWRKLTVLRRLSKTFSELGTLDQSFKPATEKSLAIYKMADRLKQEHAFANTDYWDLSSPPEANEFRRPAPSKNIPNSIRRFSSKAAHDLAGTKAEITYETLSGLSFTQADVDQGRISGIDLSQLGKRIINQFLDAVDRKQPDLDDYNKTMDLMEAKLKASYSEQAALKDDIDHKWIYGTIREFEAMRMGALKTKEAQIFLDKLEALLRDKGASSLEIPNDSPVTLETIASLRAQINGPAIEAQRLARLKIYIIMNRLKSYTGSLERVIANDQRNRLILLMDPQASDLQSFNRLQPSVTK